MARQSEEGGNLKPVAFTRRTAKNIHQKVPVPKKYIRELKKKHRIFLGSLGTKRKIQNAQRTSSQREEGDSLNWASGKE